MGMMGQILWFNPLSIVMNQRGNGDSIHLSIAVRLNDATLDTSAQRSFIETEVVGGNAQTHISTRVIININN
jgi:hypothetical protein